MSQAQLEIQLIAMVVSVACALPGVFLVLRRMAMMSDAISHSILLGIVAAFFITHDLTSPLLIIGATITGILTVVLVELLNRTGLVREDAAIGLIFPLLFSLGVILISRYAGNIHLDTDAVLLGELAFAPFDRFIVFGHDLGPKSLYLMSGILIINILFISVFFKELKLVSFDAGLAMALGFSPTVIHYSLMTLVSITAVGAFDAVGSILVVALMIGPPVTAYLLTEKLSVMIIVSSLVGIIVSLCGYWMAHLLDTSIAGSMATMVGFIFLLTYLFAPEKGLIALVRRRRRQKIQFSLEMLLVHLLHHEGSPEAERECHVEHLSEHLYWDSDFSNQVVKRGEREEFLQKEGDYLILTPAGQEKAKQSMTR
ncbi:MAG: metal ABC transporter permease [Calditrichia bacterium]|nr:metal ABC transporter permease [Calditrichia bacterium]